MSFQGSCHCGAVTFTVDAPMPTNAVSCNCSICRRKGLLLSFFPEDSFTLNSGKEQLRGYEFNKHLIQHQFCQNCGVQPFSSGNKDGVAMRAINLRCVPALDLDALEIQKFNGAAA